MRLAPLASLSLLALFGCSETGLNDIKSGNGGPDAQIEVTPDYVDFGMVGSDVSTVSRTFTVRSIGEEDLEVSGITLSGEQSFSFMIVNTDTSFTLPSGAEREIEVLYAPTSSEGSLAEALIASNAADNETVPVTLEGQPAVPDLQISPDPLEFGNSYIGCERQSEAELTNVGAETLVVDALDWTGDAANMGLLTDTVEFPLVLEPGDSAWVSFWFNPSAEADYTGHLVATTNEPEGQTLHDQLGAGIYAGFYTDSWEMPYDPPADIMFAVDQSCSMNDDASRLASNFSSFISQLSGYSNDWQIMVVNDDDGCTNSGVLTPSTSGYTSTFASAVQSGGGSYTESLLTVGVNAIENAAGTSGRSCNNGFLRADAMLHLVLVSDEPEQSWDSWSNLVNRITAAKAASGGTAGNTRISAIAGDVPYGCSSADAGTGYGEAVTATGGVFLSICSDWASPTNLAMLAETSVSQDTFELSRVPVPSTIEVTHDGSVRSTSDWTFDSAANAVRILSDIPSEGETVDISYNGVASCD